MISRQVCKVAFGSEGWLWAVIPYSTFLYLCGFPDWTCTCLQMFLPLQYCIWNLSIWNLGLFYLLSNKVYGIQSFITCFPFVGCVSMIADASQLVLSHSAGLMAIVSWNVFSFLQYVLGYTHTADFWTNVLAQVLSFVLHFMGIFLLTLPVLLH